jgi:hypothetical protein
MLALVPLLICFGIAQSHHGPYGQFAIDDPIDFTGTVVGVEWQNPHAMVLVEAQIDSVKAVYRIELRSITQLAGNGWQGDELAVGEQVRVVNAAMSLVEGSSLICCARIYDTNGKEYFTDPRFE